MVRSHRSVCVHTSRWNMGFHPRLRWIEKGKGKGTRMGSYLGSHSWMGMSRINGQAWCELYIVTSVEVPQRRSAIATMVDRESQDERSFSYSPTWLSTYLPVLCPQTIISVKRTNSPNLPEQYREQVHHPVPCLSHSAGSGGEFQSSLVLLGFKRKDVRLHFTLSFVSPSRAPDSGTETHLRTLKVFTGIPRNCRSFLAWDAVWL
jgi:hypothetical protein